MNKQSLVPRCARGFSVPEDIAPEDIFGGGAGGGIA